MVAAILAQCKVLSRDVVVGAVTAVIVVRLLGQWVAARRARRAFPPGPPGMPLIGNVLDMPNVKEWLVYDGWAKKHGDIVGVQMAGLSIVILNKVDDVKALFTARAGNYSNRMSTAMIRMSGWEAALGMTNVGDYFRAQRRLMSKFLGSQVIKKTIAVQEEVTRETIANLIHKPGDVQTQLKWMTAKLLLRLTYGYDAADTQDPMFHWIDVALESLLLTMRPDWVVNLFPFLQYLPSWLPGMGFKKVAADSRYQSECSHDEPFNENQIAVGTAQPSFALDVLSNLDTDADELLIKEILNNMYVAGADTLIGTTSWFILAMSLFSDVQRHAQTEIDALTDGTRLPSMDDRPSLPYLDALFKEVLRWNAVTNLGVPHISLEEDVYKGFRFPKGTVFMPNIWSIFHDSKKYPDPFNFKPERFLHPASGETAEGVEVNEDPHHIAFGFGLRYGRYLADSVVWTLMARILATCDISSAEYTNGAAITNDNIDSTSGFVSCPLPFTCKIVPRSDLAETLLIEGRL
ncbi:cytochrome P450 [Auriculariales sp. MPI-PUGE-AT-0066]|nr:cytochrome P450 [Auriculariales sp. MPI-PUGE-AT-0066]